MTTPTTELPELPAHLVFIDQSDDSTFGSIADDAWERDESSELKLGAPLFTAGQMRAYGDARERALLARLGEQQPVAWLWQHEETCRSGFVDAWQVENGWQEANPRNKIIRPVYDHPSPAPVGAQEREAFEAWLDGPADGVRGHVATRRMTMNAQQQDAARDGWQAARSAAQGAVQVPAGMALVPVEPTDAMLDATTTCHKGRLYPQDNVHGPRAMRRREYVAMLAAAPAHAGERQGDSA